MQQGWSPDILLLFEVSDLDTDASAQNDLTS